MPEVRLYRDIIDVLCAEHEKVSPPPGATDAGSARMLGCVWGLYCQIHRHARAAAVLADNGLEHEVALMARIMLEHTVVMHWVIERGDRGVDALLAKQSKSMKAWLKNTAQGSALAVPPEIAAEIASGFEGIDESKALREFSRTCREIGGEDLYATYGFLCNFVHPTTTTSNLYCDSSGKLTLTPSGHGEINISLVTYCLIWAERDFDRITPGQPRADELTRLAESVQAKPVLPPYRAIPPAPPANKRGSGNRGRGKK